MIEWLFKSAKTNNLIIFLTFYKPKDELIKKAITSCSPILHYSPPFIYWNAGSFPLFWAGLSVIFTLFIFCIYLHVFDLVCHKMSLFVLKRFLWSNCFRSGHRPEQPGGQMGLYPRLLPACQPGVWWVSRTNLHCIQCSRAATNFLSKSINHFVYKITENIEKWPSQFPKTLS